jgi:SSS family solute:Na+ symporter
MNIYIFYGIVLATLLINIVWAFLKRKGITFSIYAADPNEHNTMIIAFSLAGTIVGGGMFLAVGQIGYEAGTAGYILGFTYLVGLAIVGSITKAVRNMMDKGNHDSILDLLSFYYGNRVTLQFCIVNLAMYVFLLAGQFIALFLFAKYIKNLTGIIWLPWSLVIIAIISLFFYPVIGGLRKDIRTDIIQIIIIFLASAIILWKIIRMRVLSSIWVQLTPAHIFGTGYGLVFIIGIILFYMPSFLVRMDIWQRIRAANSETASSRGFWIAGIISCFFYLLFTTIGMWAYALKLPVGKYSTFELVDKQFQNPIMLGVIFGAFFAAVLSSADTFINNTSLFLTRIAFPSLWANKHEPTASNSLLHWSRIFAISFIVMGLILGLIIPNIIDLLVGAFSLLLIYIPIILGLFVEDWRNERAAFWSSNLGVVLFIILFFGWNPKIAFAPSVVVSIIAYVSILYLSKRLS